MSGDLFQLSLARRMVVVDGEHWMLCYVLHPQPRETHFMALAVKCHENGDVPLGLTNPLALIQFTDADLVTREPSCKEGR